MNSKLSIRNLYSPRHPDTRGKCCLKLTDLVHYPPLLFTMMMWCHMTWFQPPDWLLLCASSIPWCLEGQSFQLVSRGCSQWRRKLCEYIFQSQESQESQESPCQLTNKGSKSLLKSHFTELMDHFVERTSDLVKLVFGDSWFSHMDHLTHLIAL